MQDVEMNLTQPINRHDSVSSDPNDDDEEKHPIYNEQYIDECMQIFNNTIKEHLGIKWVQSQDKALDQKLDIVVQWLDEYFIQGSDPENKANVPLSVRQHAGVVANYMDRGTIFALMDLIIENPAYEHAADMLIKDLHSNLVLEDLMRSTDQWIRFYELAIGASAQLQKESQFAYADDVLLEHIPNVVEWLKCSRLI